MIIEETVIRYLKEKLQVDVYAEKPKNLPDTFLLVEKTGSSRNDMIRSAMIVVQSYAQSLYSAAELNEKVITCMDEITDLPEISKVSLNSDYDFTDLSMKRYRYQAVFDIIHY